MKNMLYSIIVALLWVYLFLRARQHHCDNQHYHPPPLISNVLTNAIFNEQNCNNLKSLFNIYHRSKKSHQIIKTKLNVVPAAFPFSYIVPDSWRPLPHEPSRSVLQKIKTTQLWFMPLSAFLSADFNNATLLSVLQSAWTSFSQQPSDIILHLYLS